MGRKSKREEFLEVASQLFDVDRSILGARFDALDPNAKPDDGTGDVPPETFAEFRDEFMRILWTKRNGLSDTSFTQALQALARMAEANKNEDTDKEDQQLTVAEIIADSRLSVARKRELLAEEKERAAAEVVQIESELEALNA